MTDFVVHPGRLAEVSFGSYAGKAGLQDADGKTVIAFVGDTRKLRAGLIGTIDGAPHRVLSVSENDAKVGGLKGMVRLTVEAVS